MSYNKPKITFETKKNTLTLREFEGVESVSHAPIVCGFPSATLTPVLTAGFLVEQLQLPLVGIVSSPSFPAKCVVEKGLPLPSVRIYGNAKLVVIQGECKLTPELISDLSSLIFGFAERHSSALIITAEGLPQESYDKTKDAGMLKFISTNGSVHTALSKSGHTPITDGVISGLSGVLLSEGVWSRSDVVCLVASTSSLYPDVNATIDIIKSLAQLLSIQIDTVPLEKKAQKIDTSFAKLMREEQRAASAPLTMYG